MDKKSDVEQPPLEAKLPHWWRVLPGLILIIIISNIDGLILNDFIEYRYTNKYRINSTSSQSDRERCLNESHSARQTSSPTFLSTVAPYPLSSTTSTNDLIQASTALLNVYISLAATVPGILTSILLAANCDRIGRKPLLLLPFIGKIIRYIMLVAIVHYDLSNLWIILSVMFDSVFGTSALNILSSFAYVSDCTNDKSRTRAIIITDVCINCGRVVPLLTLGLYLEHPKYLQSAVFTLLLSIAGLIFCIVLQPESNLQVRHQNFFRQLGQIDLMAAVRVFRVYTRRREEHKQRTLLLLVTTHLSIIAMICGYVAIYYLYLYGAPFCMDAFGVSLTSTAQTVSMILLTIPFAMSMGKHSDHLVLPALGTLAYMAQLVIFGIGQSVWLIYLAVCISGLFPVLSPVIRSRISKLVEPDEYAVVFILASVFESGGYYAISALANGVYQASVTFFPGLVFFVFVAIGAFAILLMM